jgi:hypothetical protein
MGGATKIKQYVFESAKLPEIRGASALLDRINQVAIPALFNVYTDPDDNSEVQKVREQFARRHGIAPPDAPECVIYVGLPLFRGRKLKHVPRLYSVCQST